MTHINQDSIELLEDMLISVEKRTTVAGALQSITDRITSKWNAASRKDYMAVKAMNWSVCTLTQNPTAKLVHCKSVDEIADVVDYAIDMLIAEQVPQPS